MRFTIKCRETCAKTQCVAFQFAARHVPYTSVEIYVYLFKTNTQFWQRISCVEIFRPLCKINVVYVATRGSNWLWCSYDSGGWLVGGGPTSRAGLGNAHLVDVRSHIAANSNWRPLHFVGRLVALSDTQALYGYCLICGFARPRIDPARAQYQYIYTLRRDQQIAHTRRVACQIINCIPS